MSPSGPDVGAQHRCPASTPYTLRTPPPGALARRATQVTAAAAHRLGPEVLRRATSRRATGAELAVPLRKMCDDLGATFLKYGQLVASSPSLFGEEMAAAFRSCLDTGPPVPFSAVVAEMERSIGGPISDRFDHLELEPLGRASLAVVHRARLRDGTDVAVKVLRPGIEATIAADLVLMRRIFRGLARAAVPGLADVLVEAIDGLRLQLEEELDLRNEATVMAYFRDLPEGARLPLVVVPRPYPELSSRRVLVMEFLDGVAIDDAVAANQLGVEVGPLVEQTVKAWFLSALRGGIFHGDVHAGNILLLRDGRAGVIDWGIVGRLSPDSHWLLRRFIGGALGDEAAWDELAEYLEAQLVADGSGAVPVLDRATLRTLLRDQIGGIVSKPFGEFSLSAMILTLQGHIEQARGAGPGGRDGRDGREGRSSVRSRVRRARSLTPPGVVMDRGMILLAKQLAYFERYGTMYLGDIPVLHDQAFFRAALDAGPLDAAR